MNRYKVYNIITMDEEPPTLNQNHIFQQLLYQFEPNGVSNVILTSSYYMLMLTMCYMITKPPTSRMI